MNWLIVFLVVFTTTFSVINTKDILDDQTCSEKTLAHKEDPSLKYITQNEVSYDNSDVERRELTNNAKNTLSYVYAIEEDLLRQNWEEQEQPCLSQLLKLITNVQNSTLWATWIWDSMGFPVGQLYGTRRHLGNFDQCINLPWKDFPEFRTQYCISDFNLSELDPKVTTVDPLGPVQKYIRYKTKHSLKYNSLSWGICAPVVCKPKSIAKFAAAMFNSSHLGLMKTQYNVSVNPTYCHVADTIEERDIKDYIILLLAIILIITTLLCTYYYENFKEGESKFISEFARAFYINANAKSLIKVHDTSVRSLLGVRVASNFLIVTGHLWLIKNSVGVINSGEMDQKMDEATYCTMFNIDILVDIFFMISGLLMTKSILEQKHITFNPLIVIARRYIRLICSTLIVLLLLPIVLLEGDPGPLVKKIAQAEVDFCTANGWKSLLMIGNYADGEDMCYPILWSLACDFHFFLIGVFIYWIYRKNMKAGIKAYAICAGASLVIPVIHGYIYQSPAVITFDFRTAYSYRKFPVGDPAYIYTHLRAGPYFVGMGIGYIIALFNKQKIVISKKSSILAFFVLLATFLSLYNISGTYHVREYGALEGAIFSVMRRNIFSALIGFLIIICEYGTLPFISKILSWSGLVPFSKLSYGVYLTHFMLLLRLVSRTRAPLRGDAIDDVLSTFGLMIVAVIMSVILWLFWEAPTIYLLDMILKRFVGEVSQQNGKVETIENSDGKLSTTSEEYEAHNDSQEKNINKYL